MDREYEEVDDVVVRGVPDDDAGIDGCSCDGGDCGVGCGCVRKQGGDAPPRPAYDADGRLADWVVTAAHAVPVFECHDGCACRGRCGHAVSQRSPLGCLEVRDAGHKGRGLFVAADVPRGTFLCCYTGRLVRAPDVPSAGAPAGGADGPPKRRRVGEGAVAARAPLRHNYTLVVQEYIAALDCTLRTAIDARQEGSLARFVNHSESPNVHLQVVRRGPRRCAAHPAGWRSAPPLVPRVALFALRDLAASEELGFDYGDGGPHGPASCR